MDYVEANSIHVYTIRDQNKMIIVCVYVDDLLIISNDREAKKLLKINLSKEIKIKDMGEIHHYLGMKITRDRDKGIIKVNQTKYIENLLKRFNMDNCHGVFTPLDPNQDLTRPNEDSTKESLKDVPYREAVGSLMFAAQATRPDIAHAVGVVSRYNSDPKRIHWNAVKRIMRYLKATNTSELVYKRSDENLFVHCDSDWANDKQDLKSTTGYVFILSGAAVSWNSKKQPTVAASTTESEYMALFMATQEAVWLKGIYNELIPSSKPIPIYCDNKGAVDLSRNPGYRPRTKHVSIKHHFVQERNNIDVDIRNIRSEDMIADCLTKTLPANHFRKCVEEMGISTLH